MPICAGCQKGYDADLAFCPHCSFPAGAERSRLTGWSRYALRIGLILSYLGVIVGVVLAVAYLVNGEVLWACYALLIGAPYSLAMAAVFRHVLRNG